jgi:hypothetical protein
MSSNEERVQTQRGKETKRKKRKGEKKQKASGGQAPYSPSAAIEEM